MLQGMAPGQAKAVNEHRAVAVGPMLLYTPAVAADDFDVAIGYLFRRLEENASTDNFMRSCSTSSPDRTQFEAQAAMFRDGMAMRDTVAPGPADAGPSRAADATPADAPFANEPDTDPSLRANRDWIATSRGLAGTVSAPSTTDIATSTGASTTLGGASDWRSVEPGARRTCSTVWPTS